MTTINVYFYHNDFEIHKIECDKNLLIGDFFKLAERYFKDDEEEKSNFIFNFGFLKGKKIDTEKHIKDYIDDLKNSAIFLTYDEEEHLDEKDILINLDDFQIKSEFNDDTYEAIDKRSGKPVFIKKIGINYYNHQKGYIGGSIYRDIHMFEYVYSLNVPGITEIIGFRYPLNNNNNNSDKNKDLNGFLFITEYMANRSFYRDNLDYISSNGAKNEKINPTIRSKIIFGVAAALKQLHKNKIVYSSLNLNKLMLDDKFEVKLSDITGMMFKKFKFEERYTIAMPNSIYLPPEFTTDEYIYMPSMDVYSFGSFLYQMFDNKLLFADKKQPRSFTQYMMKIRKGKRPIKSEKIPDHYWKLIQDCWKHDPSERPTIDEIVALLKDDKFALEEFGMKTNLDELHQYQFRIDPNIPEMFQTIEKLSAKVKEYESILYLPVKENKNINENIFIDDEEEQKYHEVLSKINEGATSITYKVIDKKNNRIICKKILKFTQNQQEAFISLQNAIKEFEVLHKICHPCICRAFAINTSEKIEDSNIDKKHRKDDVTTVALFLEYIDYSLKDYLVKINMNNTLKMRIVIEIIHAMNFIHKNGLIHRDLKIENIMLNSIFEVKLIDFGLVRIHESLEKNYSFVSDSLTKGVGTFAYMSPEMLNEDKYDYKTDVYSFGVVLYYIFVGDLPKQNLKDKMAGKKVSLPSPSSSISKCCIDLIEKCLSSQPSERPSFDKIINFVRKNQYSLAPFVDQEIVSRRDKELTFFDK